MHQFVSLNADVISLAVARVVVEETVDVSANGVTDELVVEAATVSVGAGAVAAVVWVGGALAVDVSTRGGEKGALTTESTVDAAVGEALEPEVAATDVVLDAVTLALLTKLVVRGVSSSFLPTISSRSASTDPAFAESMLTSAP